MNKTIKHSSVQKTYQSRLRWVLTYIKREKTRFDAIVHSASSYTCRTGAPQEEQ